MIRALSFVAFILGALALLALATWGATTAATALTLALTNAAAMATVLVMACALTATLPLMAFGAFRIGQWRATQPQHQAALADQTPRAMLPAPRVHWVERESPREHARALARKWFE